jgi:hypothetical protein
MGKMNEAVAASKAKCKVFSNKTLLVGLGIMMGATDFAKRGCDLFSVKDLENEDESENGIWKSLCVEPLFERFMSFGRWKEFWRFFPEVFTDNNIKDPNPWYQVSSAIDEFNKVRRDLIIGSQWISIDESMCAWRPRKTAFGGGGLPYISFIIKKTGALR